MPVSPLPVSPGFRLDGHHALVTGAGRGLGLAAATALAEAGAAVTLAARTIAEIEDGATALRDKGLKASAYAVDVTDTQAMATLMAGPAPFDILVNNAGTNKPGPFIEVTEENYDLVMGLNLRSAFFTSQAFSRRLIAEKRSGVIVNMTSQMGHVGAARRTIYCASKHALEGLTKALAVELAEHGIRVNSVAPTFIETPMTKPFFEDEEFRRQTLSKIKLGRLGRVEDIMGAIVYLASDAAALVTGTSLLVDGGWTAE
ncbi:SDR family NAD(P)-dependent oxidoreductase [Rhizobium rhizogenes]|uniref:SDR family NAD(P)-dependent oxidoreductase n=1 Tax=Rhizobium rhizogenes TaxID=359 RepID=UPI001573AF8B|nr:glucose 1-dehydrogenase [Rhizobium rhizogenes]NTI78487.1 glucose 1-dehydrogenase [Rhizobium rhizogenes]